MQVSRRTDRFYGLVLVLFLAVAFCGACFAAALPTVEETFDSLFANEPPVDTRLLTNNHQAWYARWSVLSGAKTTIDCTYFQVTSDITGKAFLGLLLKKAQEGVKIRLMVDNRGAFSLTNPIWQSDYLPALATFPNVEIRVYNPLTALFRGLPNIFIRTIASNHSKLVIVDGQWLVAGGRNLLAKWYSDPIDDPEAVEDADLLVRGKSVATQAKRAFEDEYGQLKNATVKPLKPKQFAKAIAPLEAARQALFDRMMGLRAPAIPEGDAPELHEARDLASELARFESMRHYASFVPYPRPSRWPVVLLGKHSAAAKRGIGITDALIRMIDSSREEIVIANPYMVLTDRARAALKAASDRGVKIRYVTNSPESTDSVFTQAWFVKEWKDYLRTLTNLRIFAIAAKRKLHGKVFVFDRKVCGVGSYNMDPMSEQINAEELMLVRSAPFAKECLDWIDELGQKYALEYRIRIMPDGTVRQLVGPSDHCGRIVLMILKVIGSLSFLRPVV